jgi:hypothetical protein
MASLGRFLPRECCSMSFRCHRPRKRAIQYAAAYRLKLWRHWNTGSPGQAGRRHPMAGLFEEINLERSRRALAAPRPACGERSARSAG